MTQKQELLIRGSEIRERLNTISGLSGDAITGGAPIWDVTAPPDALAVRVAAHVSALQGRIARAGDAAEAACRRQVLTYFNERPVLVGRATAATTRAALGL